jgi:hypothetical protein
MPIIRDTDNMTIPGSSFKFSAVKPGDLQATAYTLATIAVDNSGSVEPHAADLLEMVKAAFGAFEKNPISENLMARLLGFNYGLKEFHGFKLLPDIVVADYKPFVCGGSTALNDAVFSAVGATCTYAEKLIAKDYDVNGIIFIITDGEENASSATERMIKDAIEKSKRGEVIESLMTILIGINTKEQSTKDPSKTIGEMLLKYQQDAGINHYIDMGDVTSQKLAKLGGWVSKSISSQSKALKSGGSAPVNLVI